METSKLIYYRRCHVCDAVASYDRPTLQKDRPVQTSFRNCAECGKALAPFFFFDEARVGAPDENGVRAAVPASQPSMRGFSVVW